MESIHLKKQIPALPCKKSISMPLRYPAFKCNKTRSPDGKSIHTIIPSSTMAFESTKPDAPSNNSNKHKNLDQDIKELISALTSCFGSIQQSTNTGYSGNHEEEDQGVKIITLAGSNQGASMHGVADVGVAMQAEQDEFTTFVNSNFQAINNSIMLGGSHETNDPGVHLDILDDVEEEEPTGGKKKKKKKKARVYKGYTSGHQSENSNKTSDGERN